MRTILILVFVSIAAFAKGPMGMQMGGVGYLLTDGNGDVNFQSPDGNYFRNSSQMASIMGFGVQGAYSRMEVEALGETLQGAAPSAVWGNGKVGLGAYASRLGTSLTESGEYSDSVGGAMGLGMAGGRMSLGVGYNRGVGEGQTDDGKMRADFALNAVKGSGFIFGVGASTTINAVVTRRAVQVGAGYQFAVNNAVEAYYSMNDLDDKDDTTMGGYMTLGGKMLYFGGGVNYHKSTEISQAVLRLGGRIGTRIDLSGFTTYTFDTDYDPMFGGTFRVMF